MNPKRLDYSLLLAFDALMSERSVTRAARRMHMSQPTMSHALARLRDAFDDPIMVRGTGGMLPTPKALQLHGSIRQALEQLSARWASSAASIRPPTPPPSAWRWSTTPRWW